MENFNCLRGDVTLSIEAYLRYQIAMNARPLDEPMIAFIYFSLTKIHQKPQFHIKLKINFLFDVFK